VGTTLAVKERIKAIVGDLPFSVADNPEFLKEGAAIADFMKPDRVVVGVEDDRTGDLMRELYDPFVRQGHPVYVMDILSAEMVKYASNNFLATKISFINEMANLCEAYGADIARVREGMCADKRIGNQFLYPGLGYGGSCFPKDTLACIMMGNHRQVPTQLSQAVHDVNQRQRKRFWDKIEGHFKKEGGLSGKTIAFWGMAFKPQTDDIREAPAVDLMKWAKAGGAKVRAHDPVAAENVERENPGVFEISDGMYETLRGAHALVISTDWNEFKAPDFQKMQALMAAPVIFDGRNLYKPEHIQRAGFTYYSVGRGPVQAGKMAMAH
jgi:UDPglucose 6-dehydrogenase